MCFTHPTNLYLSDFGGDQLRGVGLRLGFDQGLERVQARLDDDWPRDLVDERLLGLQAVAGDAEDGRAVAVDAALLDELLGDGQGHAAGGLGPDSLGLGQFLDA